MKPFFALFTALLLFSGVANAGPISKADLRALIEQQDIITGETTDTDNSYRFDVTRQGSFYSVRTDECDAASTCKMVMFFVTFKVPRDIDPETYIKINDYNDSYFFGRAFGYDQIEDDNTSVVGVDLVVALDADDTLTTDDLNRFIDVWGLFLTHWNSDE